ncbi:type II toxin-antitoxin system PemK/MazF family toxin [Clostridium sp. ZBS15]|uniref:type II toxin-antitoxin system PemK/MazF family toxin n=1 Tax=Clostridium sp. ZBS15 TaxID=2949969 RepID=UPI002079B17C
MYFSKIKTRHIYNVIFDPVKPCEFDKKHLAVVLKKNNDKQTLIVMPLTSEENGNGINKINIGIIDSLPSSLKCNNTYAVFNQIRTVNASRFISLKEGNSIIESKMDDNLFFKLVGLGMNDITHNFDYDERIHLFKTQYEQACVLKSVNLAYSILKLKQYVQALTNENPKNPIINV